MRIPILLIITAISFSSCEAFKPLAKSSMVPEENVRKNNESPRFLRNISLNADPETATNNISELQSSNIRETNKIPVLNIGPSFNIEQVDEMQFKYAIRMDVEVEKVKNKDLYQYIESWWATPYRLGGSTHKGSRLLLICANADVFCIQHPDSQNGPGAEKTYYPCFQG